MVLCFDVRSFELGEVYFGFGLGVVVMNLLLIGDFDEVVVNLFVMLRVFDVWFDWIVVVFIFRVGLGEVINDCFMCVVEKV